MKWEKYWTRDYTYHYSENCLRCIGHTIKNLVFLRKEGNFALYSTKEEKDLFRKENHDNFIKNPSGLIKEFLEISEKYFKLAEEVHGKDLTKLSNEELLEYLKEYDRLWEVYTTYVWRIFNVSETYFKISRSYFCSYQEIFNIIVK